MNEEKAPRDGRSNERSARQYSSHKRSEATRKALLESFKSIVREDGYGAASVSKIASVAGVSRSGFYEHFANIDDLGFFLLDDLLAVTDGIVTQVRSNSPMAGSRRVSKLLMEFLFAHMFADRELYIRILRDGGGGRRVADAFAKRTVSTVRLARPEWPESRINFAAAAIGGAMMNGVFHILTTEQTISSSQAANEIMTVAPDWLYESQNTDVDADAEANIAAALRLIPRTSMADDHSTKSS